MSKDKGQAESSGVGGGGPISLAERVGRRSVVENSERRSVTLNLMKQVAE